MCVCICVCDQAESKLKYQKRAANKLWEQHNAQAATAMKLQRRRLDRKGEQEPERDR